MSYTLLSQVSLTQQTDIFASKYWVRSKEFIIISNRSQLTNQMIASQMPEYVKRYCCLYHFTTGKVGKASSPCYNHVPLGVINPIPSTVPRSPRPVSGNLRLQSRAHDINFHNHDLNEIQNKQSLPKRLAYPRVYVQKITQKNSNEAINSIANYEAFLKKKEFQEIFLLFKQFAKLTDFKSQTEVIKSYRKFAKKSQILESQVDSDSPSQFYFSHSEFVNYLIELGWQDKLAEEMWNVAFNQARFMQNGEVSLKRKVEVISMKAFAYNFRKFYLEELQSFKNCLSEAALRQRLIDLRLFLEPWFNRNIIFKENHQTWKQIQLELCAELQRYKEDKLYTKLISSIELRNKIWLFMRTLSKIIYQFTDQKNVGLDLFNQKATELINKHTQNLDVFAEFMSSYENLLISQGRSKEEKFKITDLLQFGKSKFPERMDNIMSLLRGIFKYLYFFNKNPLLTLNRQTLNLDCSGIAEICYNDLRQFLDYKRRETNHLMEMIDSVCREINQTVQARPQINGHKRFLNQCNYLAQSLLKMIRRCDFSVFYRLHLARQLYLQGNAADTKSLRSILFDTEHEDRQIKESFWRETFSFIYVPELSQKESLSQRDEVLEKNYQSALGAYEELRKKLEGKLPSSLSSKDSEINQKNQKKSNQQVKNDKSKTKKSNKEETLNQEIDSNIKHHQCFNSAYCSLCNDVCSTQVTSSLNKIDEMSSYLMDMLRDI